jgi:hypothetical protein
MGWANSKWMAGVVSLWLAAACEGGNTDLAAKPDTAQGQDVQLADASSDAADNTEVSADSVVGATDAATEVSAPDSGSDTCSTPCIDNDNNPCTVAVCQAGQCIQQTVADGSTCEDGNPCTTADTCKAGQCTAIARFTTTAMPATARWSVTWVLCPRRNAN